MPDNPGSLYDQLSPLIKAQQDIYAQRAANLQQLTDPYSGVDPVKQAYAGALLAPTKSGSFFESLGNAVNAERGVLSKLRQDQMDQQDKIANLQMAQIKLAMEAPVQAARAEYYRNRTAGGGVGNRPIDVQRTVKIIDEFERMANSVEGKDPALAQRYRAEAEKHRSALMGAGATDVSGAEPDVSTEEDQQSGGFWDTIKEIGKEIGGQSGGSAMPSISAGGVPPSQSTPAEEDTAPAEEDQAQAKAPTKTAEPAGIYKGSTPPKEFPNARQGRDGGWYVIKDGKPYPVLK